MSDPDIFGIDCGQPLTKFQQLDHLEEGIRGRAELLDKDQQLMMINELRWMATSRITVEYDK